MNEIKLIDLQDIALPNWLPNNYVQALADIIEKTEFVPPIIVLDDELLTPDVVAALVTIKAREKYVPATVAVRDGHWLVSVDRRVAKVEEKVTYIGGSTTIIYDDWWHQLRPCPRWRDNYWTWSSTGTALSMNDAGIALNWSAEQPMLTNSISG